MLDDLLNTLVKHNFLPEDAVPLVKKLFPGGGAELYQGFGALDIGEFSEDETYYEGPVRWSHHEAAKDALRAWLSQVASTDELVSTPGEAVALVRVLRRVQAFLDYKRPPAENSFEKIRRAISELKLGSTSPYVYVTTVLSNEPYFTPERASQAMSELREYLSSEVVHLANHDMLPAVESDQTMSLKEMEKFLRSVLQKET